MEVMTEQDESLLIRLCESGENLTAITRLLPYKRQTIRQTILKLRQKGVLNGQKANKRENTQARVLNAYNGGLRTISGIVNFTSLSRQTVRRCLLNHNIRLQRPRVYRKKDISERSEKTQSIVNDLKNGMRVCEIVQKENVSRQYIYKVKNKFLCE